MEAFFMILIYLIVGVAFVATFQWLSSKYLGVRYFSRGQFYRALEESQKEKEQYELLLKVDPMRMKEATENCINKGYYLTYENLVDEYMKIKNL